MNKITNLFKGRISGSRLFLGHLFLLLGLCIIMLPLLFSENQSSSDNFVIPLIILVCIYWFLSWGLIIRRLHDIGKSGWWSLVLIIPYFNFIYGIYLLLADADNKSNKYGPTTDSKRKFINDIFNIHPDNTHRQEENIYCAKCGNKQEIGSNFCTNCGSSLVKIQ